MTGERPTAWRSARHAAFVAGRAAMADPVDTPLAHTDGLTLASALASLTDLPAFATSSVDGYAVAGPGPWRLCGQVLAGTVPAALRTGEATEIATGAMVPPGTSQIVRLEDATRREDGLVEGAARAVPEWREAGDEARRGDPLVPAGAQVTPAVVGLAAACGHDTMPVVPAVRAAVVVFGDELLTAGPSGAGRIRDSLGPQLPLWLRRLGAVTVDGPLGPVADTREAHLDAIRAALTRADVVCTTGGTMRGPVDHVHAVLDELGARYVVDAVAVRPGYPMLLAELAGASGRAAFVVGLPGNPQSAVVALVSLVVPLLDGLAGRAEPALPMVTLGEVVARRGEFTHLALVRLDGSGRALPLGHSGSAMLRGLAQADGFAVIEPGAPAGEGASVPFAPLPFAPLPFAPLPFGPGAQA